MKSFFYGSGESLILLKIKFLSDFHSKCFCRLQMLGFLSRKLPLINLNNVNKCDEKNLF